MENEEFNLVSVIVVMSLSMQKLHVSTHLVLTLFTFQVPSHRRRVEAFRLGVSSEGVARERAEEE